MTIVEAMDDGELFALFFMATAWRAWRALLAALFALPMDDDALALYRAHTGRDDPPAVPFKEAALVVGRRGGKSRLLALIAVFLAIRDYSALLAPGEVGTVGVIAADRRQARTIFRYVTGLLHAVPMLKAMITEETSDSITLSNRVVIEIATASLRTTRGYTYIAVLCDEIAFWRSDDSANPDLEIIAAIRPGLSTIPGAMLLLASSPYRRRGALYSTFTRHYGRNDARVLVWKADTASMNPGIDPSIIEEAYQDDPENAASEYGAEFRNDLSDFVPRAVVEACTITGRYEIAPIAGLSYVAFVDPAGGTGADRHFCLGRQ